MLIDTHAHINLECFENKQDILIMNAIDSGVEKIILPSVEPQDFAQVVAIANSYDNVYCALGIHPSEVKKYSSQNLDEIRRLCRENKKIVAIGEIGLDYYWDKSFIDLQKEIFIAQIELAKELKLPILVHDREAHQDTFDILKSLDLKDIPVILHCYSGSWEFAKEFLKMNCYIALGGVVTFKNAIKTKEVAKNISLEKLLLETDCPYLTPVPFRGEQNEPAYVKYVAQEIANIRECSFEEIAEKTTANALKIFNFN